MGAAASTVLPEHLDQQLVLALTGGAFDADIFNRYKNEKTGKLPRSAFLTLCNRTDVFFLHDWWDSDSSTSTKAGSENNTRAKITEINSGLKKAGLLTWFCDDMKRQWQLRNNNLQSDCEARCVGLEHAKCILVFITDSLIRSLAANSSSINSSTDSVNDSVVIENSAQELQYALRCKQQQNTKFIAVVLDDRLRNAAAAWGADLNAAFSGSSRPHIDASYTAFACDGDCEHDARKHQTVQLLVSAVHEAVIAAIGRPVLGFKDEQSNSAAAATAGSSGDSSVSAKDSQLPSAELVLSPNAAAAGASPLRRGSTRKRRSSKDSTTATDGGDDSPSSNQPLQISLTALVVDRNERLGSGNFGVVFAGSYFGSAVAVKELSQLTESDQVDALKEARVMCQLQHQYVLRSVGVNFCVLPYYIVAEKADLSLSQLIHEQSFRTVKTIVRLLRDVSRAMEFLHSRFVIHRDLKPRNVLLLMPGFQVKLSDFGLAKVKTVSISRRSTSNATATAGNNSSSDSNISNGAPPPRELASSAAYLAPELMNFDGGSLTYSAQSDIYAFGILANEALTQSIPFDGLQLQQIARKVVDRKSRPDLFFASTELVDSLSSGKFTGSSKQPQSQSRSRTNSSAIGASATSAAADNSYSAMDAVTRACSEQLRDLIRILWHDLPGKRLEFKQHSAMLSKVYATLPDAAAPGSGGKNDGATAAADEEKAELKILESRLSVKEPSDKFLRVKAAGAELVGSTVKLRSALDDRWSAQLLAFDSCDLQHYVRYLDGALAGSCEWIPLLQQAYWRANDDSSLVLPLLLEDSKLQLPTTRYFPALQLPIGWEVRYHPHSHQFVYREIADAASGRQLLSIASSDAYDTTGVTPELSPLDKSTASAGADSPRQQQQLEGDGEEKSRPVAPKMNRLQAAAAALNIISAKQLLISRSEESDPTALAYCSSCSPYAAAATVDEGDDDTCGFSSDSDTDADAAAADGDFDHSSRKLRSIRSNSRAVGIAEASSGKYTPSGRHLALPPCSNNSNNNNHSNGSKVSAAQRPLFSPQAAASASAGRQPPFSEKSSPAGSPSTTKCSHCCGERVGSAFDVARWAVSKAHGRRIWAHAFEYDDKSGAASFRYPQNELSAAHMQLLLLLYKAQCAVRQQLRLFSEVIVASTAVSAAVQVLQNFVQQSSFRQGEIRTVVFDTVLVGSKGFYPKEPVDAMEAALFSQLTAAQQCGALRLDRFPGGSRVVVGESIKWNFENEGSYYDGVVVDIQPKNNTFVVRSVTNPDVVEKDVRRKNIDVPKNMSYRIMNLMDKMIKLKGNTVLSLEADSPFAAAGVEVGDMIVGIDNIAVSRALDIAKRIEECSGTSSPECSLRFQRHLVSKFELIDALRGGQFPAVAKIFSSTSGWALGTEIKAIVDREYDATFRELRHKQRWSGD